MTREAELAALKQRLREISDLRGAEAVLGWDQATYMPPGGAEARGRQLALLSRLAHERLADPAIGRLLDSLAPWAEAQGADSDAAALVRVTRRDFDRATRVPSAFIQRLSEHTAATYHAWERARPANDFAAVRPLLEKTVELSRELAAYYTGYAHPYDALIDLAEDGMTVAAVRTLFAELRAGLVPLIEAIRARPEADDRCLTGDFPEQRAAGVRRKGDPRLRLRLHARPPGQDGAPVHDQARPRRRADHHALPHRQPVRRPVLHAARGRARDVRAGHRRRARRHAAVHRHDVGRPRKPVAAVGEPRGPQPAVLAPLVRVAAGRVPRRARRRRRRHVLSRDQQGASRR